MQIIAFGASSSRYSINRTFASYVADLLAKEHITKASVDLLDLNDFEMPIYSFDREETHGIPDLAKAFHDKLDSANVLIVSFAEHNGSYSAAFKNIFDWASRHDANVYRDKPCIFLSTSPGAQGGASVLATAVASAPYMGASLQGSLSIGSWYEVFDNELGSFIDQDAQSQVTTLVAKFASTLSTGV